jgi:hypothetical protein
MIQYVTDAIERTHRLTGVPRQQVAEGWTKGTMPMDVVGGAAVPAYQKTPLKPCTPTSGKSGTSEQPTFHGMPSS